MQGFTVNKFQKDMHITLRFIRHFLAISLFVSLFLIILGWLLLQGSLPHYEGSVNLPGLSAPVMVERDVLGTVTLNGQNRLDLATALGYAHAQERFFEMDLMRRQAAGELAELFGSAALENDLKARKFRMRARASAIISQLPAEQHQLLESYRNGVNKGIEALAVRPYPYLLTRTQPSVWRNEDSLLVIFAMFFTLNESNIDRELGFSIMRSVLPDKVYQYLTATGGSWDAPLAGESFARPPIPAAHDIDLQALHKNLFKSDHSFHDNMPGSNNFAVSGALTGGAAIVANDMHLALRVPNLWFRTRLIYPSHSAIGTHTDVTGVSLPGVPSIIIGSNRHIAWSFTNSYGDFADWIRVSLDPHDNNRYRTSTGWQSINTFHETIRVNNAPDEQLIVQETEWGPLIAIDHDKTPLALAWTALHPEAINLKLIELEQTKAASEAALIAQQAGMPAQNFIVGDHNGNISWTIAGRIPVRRGNYDPQLPSDWSSPDTGWNGWLDTAQYPIINNPDSHRLWTANARTVSGDLLNILGNGGYDLGARASQIRDGLFARNQFTEEDLLAIQLDHRALLMTRWYHLLKENLTSADNSPWATAMQQTLEDWDGTASTESSAYRIVRTFRYEVIKTILNGFSAVVRQNNPAFNLPRLNHAEYIAWQLIEQQPNHLLPPVYKSWEELLLHCAQQIAETAHQETHAATQQSWGEYNAARIRHPLSQKLPIFIAKWLDMPADPLPGDHNMPRIQAPNFGASQRSAVAPGHEEQGYFDMPGGQSGHPLSPYYGSGHANWVNGKPTPFLPGISEKKLLLVPEV